MLVIAFMERTIDFRYSPEVIQTCIGRVDDSHKTIVREDGSLCYDYVRGEFSDEQKNYAEAVTRDATITQDNYLFTYRLKPTFTHTDTLVEQHQDFGDSARAVVTTVEEYEDTTFTWTSFAYETDDGNRVDVVRWWLEAGDEFGHAPTHVELELDGPLDEGLPDVIETEGTTAFWSDEGLQLPGLNHYEFLEAGETREGAFAFVLEGDLDPEVVTLEWADRALEETKEYWDGVDTFVNEFHIPDDDVMGMLEACGRNILQARELVGGDAEFQMSVREYQVGPTEYRGLWIVDGHFILEAAEMMGHKEDAFNQGVLALLRRVKPNGAIQDIAGHDKETGIALATFARQCELMDDDERLTELWPTMVDALEFLESERERAEAMGEEYPAQKLFPPAFLDGGIHGPYPDYTTPLWVLVGLKYAYEEGRRLDLEGYERFGELYDEVMDGFEACAQRDMKETDEGIPYVPMIMEDIDYNPPQSATWAFAHAIYPGEVFDSNSDYTQNLLDLLESVDGHQGLPANTGWIHDQAVWGYSGMFYAQAFLYAGRPEKAVDYLYAFANHAAPSRVWREEQAFSNTHSAEFCGDMPHNWGSAEFIRLVRNLLVFEVGDDLELLRGLPDEWLPTEDDSLVLEATPTRYGDVDLRLTRSGDEAYRLEVERRPGNKVPETLQIHWDGTVEGDLSALEPVGDNRWAVSGDTTELSVELSL